MLTCYKILIGLGPCYKSSSKIFKLKILSFFGVMLESNHVINFFFQNRIKTSIKGDALEKIGSSFLNR
jgi:hypothetical protein